MNHTPTRKEGSRWLKLIIWTVTLVAIASGIAYLLISLPKDDKFIDDLLQETVDIKIETEAETETQAKAVFTGNPVPEPEIDEQLLPKNKYSRPGKKVKSIDKIVIHYLANPGTTAQENHDYFASLKKLKDTSMSANFIVGLDGEIIECVPPGEIAYASNEANEYSISIENCHLDESGRFTQETYDSLIHLTAWLLMEYDLERDDIIRHYDVTGKECPIYFVEHSDRWEVFKDNVMNYIDECRAEREAELMSEAGTE